MYFDLAQIEDIIVSMPDSYHKLSDSSRQLSLSLLTVAKERWRWRNNGAKLTTEEWDQAEAMVDQAIEELIETMLTGMILLWTTDTIPDGFLLCNGAAVSRTDYAALFAVCGVTYGVGDGEFTFNLPDLTGRVPVGQSSTISLGEDGGEAEHTLTIDEIPAHDHSYHRALDGPVTFGEIPGTAAISWNATTGSAGGGGAHNNMPPYLGLNYIIKT